VRVNGEQYMDLLEILSYFFARIRENVITLFVAGMLTVYLWRLFDLLPAKSSIISTTGNRLFNKHDKHGAKTLVLVAALILFSLVHVINMLMYYGSFREPDPYTNILDAQTIVKNGYIPHYLFDRFTYLVNTYYSSFPVFIILLSVLNIVVSADIYSIYFFVHMIFLSILMICILILICNVAAKTFSWTPLIMLVGMTSPLYFYGALGTFVPSRLGLIILALMLLISQRRDHLKPGDAIILVLLSIAALIHITIPITSTMLLLFSWINDISLLKKKNTLRPVAILLVLIPFIVYIIYSSYALGSVVEALLMLWRQLTMSVEYSKTVPPEYPKSMLTQFTRGINLAFSLILPFIASLKYLRRRQQVADNKAHIFTLILNIVSYVYILIAVINYVVYGRPVFGSYFLVVASFLMGLASSIILIKILENTEKAVYIYVLIALFAISFIGVTIDPYVYRTPSYSWYLDFTNQMRIRVLGKALISSPINEVQIISSDQSSCVLGINTYLSFIMHYYYDTSIELNELKCYVIVTSNDSTHVIYSDGTFYLV
jgi:hypothetical protein